ncbi:hypothetical protein, partial [Anaerobaca lacustris]|nr:hypothetical protein [Sedimentisphaerales bacterium M17dextr]
GLQFPDMGESFGKALEHSTVEPFHPCDPTFPEVDYAALERDRRAPFDELGARLDQLVELTSKGIVFATESTKTQTCIAAEIKGSGEEASKLGRDSLKITRWGFYVTMAVFILTVTGLVFSELHRRRGNIDAEFFRQRAQQFTTGLGGLTDALVAGRETLDAELKALLVQMEQAQAMQDKQVRAILDSQAELIRQQAEDRFQDKETIDALRRKLSELEAKFEDTRDSHPVTGAIVP